MERWTFGEFVLDLDARELVRAGTPVSLSPKAFQLLGILVGGHGRALSKTELQDRLWPGTFVVEKNLTNLVGEIREALGDDPSQPRFIRTVHRFGYAFRETLSIEGRRHNLPSALTNFVGRDNEIAEVMRLASSARLLTLTGAGGCGKTRLALEVAAKILDRFPDGVWVIDLSALSDAELVPQTAASVLGVREGPNRSILDAVSDFVRGRGMLLVLDNCEHLITACAQLADALLRASERACILATSREGLGITGETVWRVPSLALPDPSQPLSVETLLQHDATRLFVERAAAVGTGFTATAANAADLAQVCVRLDGIPLAIELAAARVTVLSIEQINSRLNDRFRLLTGGSRTAVARQRTLEATVDWSYSLLSDSESRLLRRLSVFAGGWTMAAAEDVASRDGIERNDVLEVLSRLVDKSLVNVDNIDSSPRYYFLETVRQYARERLLESGEAQHVRDRHLQHFADLIGRAEPELTREGQVSWLTRLQREHDNLRLALEWCLASPGRADESVALAAGLFWFWIKRGYFREGQERIERALSISPAPAALRGRALMCLGGLTFFQGDFVRTRAVLDESAALGRTAGEWPVVAFVLGIASLAELERGDLDACARLAAEGQDVAREYGIPWAQGPALSGLAYLAMHQGDLDRAARLHEEILEMSRKQGEKWALGIVLFDLALLRVVQRRYGEARSLCAEGIALYQEFEDPRGIAWCLGILSAAEAAEGRALRAARLRGAMEGLLESVGAPIQTSYHEWVGNRSLDAMKEVLGDSEYHAAVAEGRSMSMSRAIQFGLDGIADGTRLGGAPLPT